MKPNRSASAFRRLPRLFARSTLAVATAAALASASFGAHAVDSVYQQRFLTQYAKIKNPANGYFSPDGVPYHSIETLMVEAPDYGHETTSETYSFWLWLEAQYGRATGDWAPLHTAWASMEKAMIPASTDQPTNAFYNPAKPATYAAEFPLPSQYPSQILSGIPVGQDPISTELASAYGTHDVYGMHWLVDSDNWYGYGRCGDGVTKPAFVNSFQRGPQESVWETVAHPSCETFKWGRTGGTQGFLSLFTGDSSYSKQWRYTDAPDADARVVQAIYWAQTWAKAQGKGGDVADLVVKAAKMGDFLRLAMFDKYFKRIGNCTDAQSCPGGTGQADGQGFRDNQHYLLSWYYAWGGANDQAAGWAWRIGSSHNHFGYQNPLAAWALSTQAAFKPLSPTGAGDWSKSLGRQVEFYRWLQSAEGGIAGGATNSWNGSYSMPPAGTATFHGMFFDPAPVYHDPASNSWFGFQAWSMERVAEYYYASGDATAGAVLAKWVAWASAHTTLGSDGKTFAIPNTLAWSGQPDNWNAASPGANAGLHVAITDTTNDVGVTAAFARTLTWYGTRANDTAAVALAKSLLDRVWLLSSDPAGVSVPELRPDYLRFDDKYDPVTGQGVYIPSGWTGTNAQGATLDANTTFLSERPKYKQDPQWPKLQAYLAGGAAPTWTYHRFWAQSDVAMAMEDYAVLTTTAITPAILTSASAVTVPEGGSASITVSLSAKPAATVKVKVKAAAGGDADLTVKPATLTFTPDDYATPQKLKFSDAVDADALNGTANFKLSGSGLTGASVLATEKDKDIVPTTCAIDFDTTNDWGNGQNTNITLRNTGTVPIVNWTLLYTESNDFTVSTFWNANVVASGRNLTDTPVSFNATIAPGASASFGTTIAYASGARPVPTNARLADRACTVTVK
jgi:hypothetical protein